LNSVARDFDVLKALGDRPVAVTAYLNRQRPDVSQKEQFIEIQLVLQAYLSLRAVLASIREVTIRSSIPSVFPSLVPTLTIKCKSLAEGVAAALQVLERMEFPKDFAVPVICEAMNRLGVSQPSVSEQYKRIGWRFGGDQYLEAVSNELAWIRCRLRSVIAMPAGDCFLRLVEVTELVGGVQRVMREWGCDVAELAIFKAVWPADDGGMIIDEMARTNRTVSVLKGEIGECIQKKCETFTLLLSWVMSMMEEHIEFFKRLVDVFGWSP
jgi:hypothetical protein